MKNNCLRLVISSLLSLLIFAGLTGCTHPIPTPQFSIYRPISPYQKSLIARMHAAGIRVIKQGDVLKVIIPTDEFFRLQTTQVEPNKIGALKTTARFVKSYAAQYIHPTILVDGYTDKVFSPAIRKTLSRQYAEVVAAYLWDAGIVRNRIKIRGMGSEGPIASDRYPAGAAFNRRVEIVVNFN